jgi:hypothetical protein
MLSSYRRSQLLEPASLIPGSDPGSPTVPNPSNRRSFARPRRARRPRSTPHSTGVIEAAGISKGSMYYHFYARKQAALSNNV